MAQLQAERHAHGGVERVVADGAHWIAQFDCREPRKAVWVVSTPASDFGIGDEGPFRSDPGRHHRVVDTSGIEFR